MLNAAHLPLICKKVIQHLLILGRLKDPFYFSYPQSCCKYAISILGYWGIQQFLGKTLKTLHAHLSRPSLNTVGKVSNFSQFVWKLFFVGYSVNSCKKIVKYPTHFGGGNVIINLRKSFNIKHEKNTKISRLVYVSACLVDV